MPKRPDFCALVVPFVFLSCRQLHVEIGERDWREERRKFVVSAGIELKGDAVPFSDDMRDRTSRFATALLIRNVVKFCVVWISMAWSSPQNSRYRSEMLEEDRHGRRSCLRSILSLFRSTRLDGSFR